MTVFTENEGITWKASHIVDGQEQGGCKCPTAEARYHHRRVPQAIHRPCRRLCQSECFGLSRSVYEFSVGILSLDVWYFVLIAVGLLALFYWSPAPFSDCCVPVMHTALLCALVCVPLQQPTAAHYACQLEMTRAQSQRSVKYNLNLIVCRITIANAAVVTCG